MVAKIDIINRALGFLGERSITNPDSPETPAGKHMANNYDDCRQEVIRRYPWNWAETWAELAITTAPAFGYSDAYALPSNFLRLLFVGDPDYPVRKYRILNQGSPNFRKVIAINNNGAATLKCAYSADVTLLSQWDPLARKVLAYWLAIDAAKAITGQDAQVATLNQMLSEELKDAVAVDGQEQAIEKYQFSYVQNQRDLADFGESSTGWVNVVGYDT